MQNQRRIVMPTVSVVMPTYNAEKFLKEAIDSILDQTYQDFELLVIDDNSKDNTCNIVKSYKDKRIKLIKGPQKGLAAALNYGIKVAKGKYIARMDADDISLPTRFEKQVTYLDKHPEITILGTWQEHFGRWNFVHKAKGTHEECKAELLFNCDLCHSTLMFRKSDFIKNNIQYPEGSPQEDYELWLSICNKVRFANLQENLCRHRTYEGSITTQKTDILTTYHVKLLQKFLRENLHIKLADSDLDLLQRKYNPLSGKSEVEIKDYIIRLNKLFEKIEKKNKKFNIFDPKILHRTLKLNYPNFARGYGNIISTKYMKSLPIRVYSIGKIPLLSVYKKLKRYCYHLFKYIPLLDVEQHRNKTKYFLFKFIPLISICNVVSKNARIDLIFTGSAENNIIQLSYDKKIIFSAPNWYQNPKWIANVGNGFVLDLITSFFYKKINFSFRCIGSGNLDIWLRGVQINKGGHNKPIFFDYKNVQINNKTIQSSQAVAWHDKPLKYSISVKDGEYCNLKLKYRRHIPSIKELIAQLTR